MDENKNEILEEGAENPVEESETADAVLAAVSDASTEDEMAAMDNEDEESTEEAEKYISKEMLLDEVIVLRGENAALKKSNKIIKNVLRAIVAVVICAALIFAGIRVYKYVYNPYNHMGYYNISGKTLADVAEDSGMSLEEVRFELRLPDDVKADTYWDAVEFIVPASYMAQVQYGVDFETIKQAFQFGDEITGMSTWGEAMDTMPLSVYCGSEEDVAEFAREYDLGDNVTGETLWGEVRKQVNKKQYEEYLAQQATEKVEEDLDPPAEENLVLPTE